MEEYKIQIKEKEIQKNEPFLEDFKKEIRLLKEKREKGEEVGMFELLSINPEELKEADALLWQKIKNYTEGSITKKDLEDYKKEIKQAKNESRTQFSAFLFQKLTPILLKEAQINKIKNK